MKEYPKRWTVADFDAMCWHDNTVHSIRIINPQDEDDFDLVFDLDYILEWIPVEGWFEFVVAPALLTFHGADKAKLNLTLYSKQNLEIDRIEWEDITPEPERKAGYRKWLFRIYLHFQSDPITLEAYGFTQVLTKEPVVQNSPRLEDTER